MRSYAYDYEDFNAEQFELVEAQNPYNAPKSIVVSYSEIFKFQTCPRQYYYRFILNRAPIEESEAIATGIKGHRLLQSFYESLQAGSSKEKALADTKRKAEQLMKESNIPDFLLVKAWTLVDNFIRGTEFTAATLLVENRFLLPLERLADAHGIQADDLKDVQIGFTPDLVTERKGGKIDIEDAKFIQRAWSKSKISRFPQLKLYQLFMELMGYDISRCMLRFFNVKTSSITTEPYTMMEEEKYILARDFIFGIRDTIALKNADPERQRQAHRTMNYTACQYCQFEYPCTLEATGKSAQITLETQYTKSNYDYTR